MRKARRWKMWAPIVPGYSPAEVFNTPSAVVENILENEWCGKPEVIPVEVREILTKRRKP